MAGVKLPPGLHLFERGWLSSNNVLAVGREQTTLIDTGYHAHADQTVALVAKVLGTRPLDVIINTHLHSDHCGGNAALVERYGPEVVVPHGEYEIACNWDDARLSYQATGQTCHRFQPHRSLRAGEQLMLADSPWQVLAAPGHDTHSLILYSPSHRLLISADALWENGFGVLFPELYGEPGLADARRTLDIIAALDVAWVIPGHGAPFSNVEQALARAYARIDYFEAHPVQILRNAAKVLLKFLLLEQREMFLADLPALLGRIELMRHVRDALAFTDDQAFAQWLVAQLEAAGAARLEGSKLINHD